MPTLRDCRRKRISRCNIASCHVFVHRSTYLDIWWHEGWSSPSAWQFTMSLLRLMYQSVIGSRERQQLGVDSSCIHLNCSSGRRIFDVSRLSGFCFVGCMSVSLRDDPFNSICWGVVRSSNELWHSIYNRNIFHLHKGFCWITFNRRLLILKIYYFDKSSSCTFF